MPEAPVPDLTVPDLSGFFTLLDAIDTPADAEFLYRSDEPRGAQRRANLVRYLTLVAAGGASVALIGEAPGHRGTVVTGVPFMSAREVLTRPGLITGSPDGDGFSIPDPPSAPWEASSAVVWATLARRRGPLPLMWPISPNHPFLAGSPATNRTPRPAEIRAGLPIALALMEALGISRVVAVGRKAQGALLAHGVEAEAVRHPAHGGAAQFAEQLLALDE